MIPSEVTRLQITEELTQKNTVVLRLFGYMEEDHCVRKAVIDALDQGNRVVLLGMSGVTGIHARGFERLHNARTIAKIRGGDVRLFEVQTRFLHGFDLEQLVKNFIIYPSKDEALAESLS